jgi:hypothetical protein
MFKQLLELAKRALAVVRDSQENKTRIKELQQQVEELTAAVQWLAYELRRTAENDAHEREKLALRLENMLLRSERRLPADRIVNEQPDDR